ncbi:hypothetical protein ACJMK2_031711 [Sinanodonta woodiana]|uniref:RNA polymerase alpha subunit n=1 Tax=Sinanodonta woodiana TaxID=1069815 RepID=A0ABD3X335_SINWO
MIVGNVIWIHRKKLSTLITDRLHSLRECDHELYITPIGGEIHLQLPPMNNGHPTDSKRAQIDYRVVLLHTNENICMDGYDMVDVSSIDAAELVCNSDETVYEVTEPINEPVHDNFGYLTALGALEESV